MKRIAKILLSVALVVCCLLGMMLCTQAATEKSVVTSPKANTAYKLGMDKGDGTVLYFGGSTESESVTYRLATTTNAAEAVDVYLESVSGGYQLYFMNNGTKTYIRVYHRVDGDPGYGKGSLEFVTSKPSEYYTYDSTAKTLVYDYDGNNAYYMGTYGSYTTFSVSNTSYITGNNAGNVDVSQYPARLYTADGSSSGGSTTTPTTTPTTQPAADVEVVSSPKTGTAYKFGLNNGSATYFFTGEMNGYYGATNTNIANAVDVYLESTTGGYYMYFMNGSTKTYIYIYEYIPTGSQYAKGSFGITTDKPSTYFVYNSDVKTMVCTIGENSYFMGTWGTYTTISASGTYYIEGDNLANVDVSQYPARLYVEKEAVSITKQPSTQKVKDGATAKFTVTASGSGLTYQWQYRTSSSDSWKNASATGNTTATLSVPATVSRSSYQYRCKITDSAGNSVYSSAVYLYVLGIKTQPKSQVVVQGETAKFTVSATGASKQYQWQYRTSSTGSWKSASATGNKTATLSVPATISRYGYQYRCKITDSASNVIYTNAVTLRVTGIKTQPVNKAVVAGKTATFTVSAAGPSLKYQWQYRSSSSGTWSSAKADGNTTATLSIPATIGRHGYQYRCKITDSAGNVIYTNVVSLYVLGIKTQPVDKTVKVGATAKFTVAATGKGLTYQWQYRSTADGKWSSASADGNKTKTLSVPASTGRNGYQYRCKITDSFGNVIYTNIVTLTVKK